MSNPKFKRGDLVKINKEHAFTKIIAENRNISNPYNRIGIVISCEEFLIMNGQICRVELQGYPGLIVEFSSNELIKV